MLRPQQSLRVLIVDDHPRYRAGLARELCANAIEVVAEVPNAAAALAAAVEQAPDVVLMDLNMPGMPAIEAIRALREQVPNARVVVLTVSAEGPDMTDAMLAGAAGYVLKDDLAEHIVAAVRAAAAGESPISPRAASMLLMQARHRGDSGLPGHELDVLELLADGRTLLKLAVDDRRATLRVVRGRLA